MRQRRWRWRSVNTLRTRRELKMLPVMGKSKIESSTNRICTFAKNWIESASVEFAGRGESSDLISSSLIGHSRSDLDPQIYWQLDVQYGTPYRRKCKCNTPIVLQAVHFYVFCVIYILVCFSCLIILTVIIDDDASERVCLTLSLSLWVDR